LDLIYSKDPQETRQILWESIQRALSLCFEDKDPFTAKDWIKDLWGFTIRGRKFRGYDFHLEWIQTDITDLRESYPPEDIRVFRVFKNLKPSFWEDLLFLAKHEMDECLVYEGKKLFYPHRHRWELLEKKKKYSPYLVK
jgi:hypothetical protein